MRPPQWSLLVLVSLILAGCASPSESAGDAQAPDEPRTSPPTPPPATAFVIEPLVVVAPDGTQRTLYEDDDHGTLVYAVRNEGDARRSAFVSLTVDGRVVDAENVDLDPGERWEATYVLDALRDDRERDISVRAGDSLERTTVTVAAWPRATETLDLGALTAKLTHGLRDREDRVVANFTFATTSPAWNLRVRLLCVDETGRIVEGTPKWTDPPEPGEARSATFIFRDCAHTRYGFQVDAETGSDDDLYGRVLLVGHDWRPPADETT